MKVWRINYEKTLCAVILCFFAFIKAGKTQSLRFTDTSYINLGNSASLKLTNFTIEAWIKIEGYASTTETGTAGAGGGQTGIVPIITKGRAATEAPVSDINYFLGYRLSDMKLIADFEDNATSLNHSVVSTATLPMNTWIQVGASFNVSTQVWRLFIGGAVESFPALSGGPFTPQSLSNVNACIGSSLNTNGTVRQGFFNGRIDEVRIWNTSLATLNNGELSGGAGLAGRWGLNEGSGTTVSNSVAGGPSGAFSAIYPIWVKGFNQSDPATNSSLDFNGVHDYITFGAAPSLNTASPAATGFTLEAWILIEGAGIATSTGSGGHATVIPIVAKGRSESDASGVNMNYFLGISNTNILLADFEEAAGSNTGLNHPVTGTTAVLTGVWTHVAATYNISNGLWNLYINGTNAGSLDMTNGLIPENISTQHASAGTALNSTGDPSGFFNGKIDEVRIWNKALTQTEIQTNMNNELTSGAGLLGRWGLNENGNITATNSVSGSANGIIRSTNITVHPTNGAASWISSGFTNRAPNQPGNPSPANNAPAPSTHPNICTSVSDPNAGDIRVRYYGRKKPTAPNQKFTVILLPDTQYYTAEPQGTNGGNNTLFKAQTTWIANNRQSMNIVYAGQLGDCTEHGDANEVEWKRADTAIKTIESPALTGLIEGLPYGICVGNHDQSPIGGGNTSTTNFYNQYFGTSRFTGRSYYGGHEGSNNDNHYQLFSASGIDFLVISMEYDTSPEATVLDWAEGLVQTYSNRKVIVMTHFGINETGSPQPSFGTQGQAIYDKLKPYPNFILFVCGHIHQTDGEARRTDTYNGNTVHTLMSDYQGRVNGGNALLRIMEFDPALNSVSVKTYSPSTGTFETDGDSQFDLPVNLTVNNSFNLLGEVYTNSGSYPCFNWAGLQEYSDYEWYVELFDGDNSVTGPVWTFTTPANGPLPVNLLGFTAAVENEKVKLIWTTGFERDNSHFDIERSKDGANFERIGTVQGTNNSGNRLDYTSFDSHPFKGVSFYRLKQVDTDQRFIYSKTERVEFTDTKSFADIYPNPAGRNSFTIYLTKTIPEPVNVKVYDMNGRLQLQKQFTNNQLIIINHYLTPGIYTIKITGPGLSENKKLVIQ